MFFSNSFQYSYILNWIDIDNQSRGKLVSTVVAMSVLTLIFVLSFVVPSPYLSFPTPVCIFQN